MIGTLDAKIPSGPLAGKWTNHKDHSRLISPNNRRKFEIIVVGSGLAGGSAAATLGELGYYQALCRQIAAGTVQMFPQTEMLDLVIVDGHAKGIITRSLRSGKIEKHAADAVVLATGGYGNVFYLSTNARGCNVTATYRAYKRGALF